MRVKTVALPISASPSNPVTVTKINGTTYYKTAPDVDSGDTELTSSVTITSVTWFVSPTVSEISKSDVSNTNVIAGNDITVADDLTVTDALTVGGAHAANGHITIADAKNVILNTTTGTKIGTATGQKIGFFNATPVAQQSALTAADAGTIDGTYGAEEQAILGNIRTRLGQVETALENLGLIAGN